MLRTESVVPFEHPRKVGNVFIAAQGSCVMHTEALTQIPAGFPQPHFNQIFMDSLSGLLLEQSCQIPPVQIHLPGNQFHADIFHIAGPDEAFDLLDMLITSAGRCEKLSV